MRKIPGLYRYKDKRTNKIYYSCRHPLSKKSIGLGTNRVIAARLMHKLNSEFEVQIEEEIWQRIKGGTVNTFRQLIEEKYLPAMYGRDLAKTTQTQKAYYANKLCETLGDKEVKRVTVVDIVTILDEYVKQDKARSAQAMRSCAIDIFIEAISIGWTKENPAAVTRNPKARVKRARLSLNQFMKIYELAETKGYHNQWLCRMMELAIVTSHAGATELIAMERPKKGELHMRIQRTKNIQRVKIPLALTLDALNWNLGDIVKKCTKTGIVTQVLLHHTQDKSNCIKGKKMHKNRLTRRFTELVRELDIDWGDKLPATLYEIRSLSARLYEKQGVDIQKLMAHKDKRSTDRYIDGRGSEWIVLKI